MSVANLLLLVEWTRRDFRIRYTQTTLGALWAFVQPLVLTMLFVLVFRRVAAVKTAVPYASFVLPGMLAWSLFSNGMLNGVAGLAGSMQIASKVSYPRIIAPLSAALLPLVDFVAGTLVLPLVFLWQDTPAHFSPLQLLGGLLGCLLMSAGFGSLIGAASIFVRDLRTALPLVMQVMLLATPVAYPRHLLPEVLQWNPLGVFIEAVRASFVEVPGPGAGSLLLSLLAAAAVFAFAIWYVEKVQPRFTDVA